MKTPESAAKSYCDKQEAKKEPINVAELQRLTGWTQQAVHRFLQTRPAPGYRQLMLAEPAYRKQARALQKLAKILQED